MKKNLNIILSLVLLGASIVVTSCSGFLDNLPKGQKIPSTLADFSALLNDEYSNQREDVTQTIILLNDRYVNSSSLGYYPLYSANYFGIRQPIAFHSTSQMRLLIIIVIQLFRIVT